MAAIASTGLWTNTFTFTFKSGAITVPGRSHNSATFQKWLEMAPHIHKALKRCLREAQIVPLFQKWHHFQPFFGKRLLFQKWHYFNTFGAPFPTFFFRKNGSSLQRGTILVPLRHRFDLFLEKKWLLFAERSRFPKQLLWGTFLAQLFFWVRLWLVKKPLFSFNVCWHNVWNRSGSFQLHPSQIMWIGNLELTCPTMKLNAACLTWCGFILNCWIYVLPCLTFRKK